ncbi:MAG: addiction module protein [Thermoanaerobaculia bacterium]
MTAKAARVLRDALLLPPGSRADIAGTLLESLDVPADKGVEAAWAKEIERRIRDVESGKVRLVPWSEVRRGLRTRLARKPR